MFYRLILFFVLAFAYSCSMIDPKMYLPGRMLIWQGLGTGRDSCVVYSEGKISPVRVANSDHIKYTGLKWASTKQFFFAVQLFRRQDQRIVNGNIVVLSIEGTLIDTLHFGAEDEIPGGIFSTWNDDKILFETIKDRPGGSPREQWNPPVTIKIFDLEKRQILNVIEGLGTELNLQLNEWPWLHDGRHFVYCTSNDRKVIVEREGANWSVENPGVYIYDIDLNTKTLIAQGGSLATVSGSTDEIAYMRNDTVYVYDVSKKSTRKVYSFPPFDLQELCWSPGGKNLYLALSYKRKSGEIQRKEVLIDATSGIEKQFHHIDHGFSAFSWR
jgi:hypothetical protein